MNTMTHAAHETLSPTAQGTQTCIGAGTFIVRRQYVGNAPALDLLRQRVQRAAHTTSSIDERVGPAV
ncbi:MAG TPA: hypothetical protein H9845_09190 [Candidatus Agathobaculum pullicola]|uniref:hypothetical protein n=1 Tax=Candidatus Agathobaculum pullicola TaxID=2838426 RepID=UPI001FA56C60|nr:hypothetical protein [Candidatus Agathobaculum pullicola]